VAGKLRLAAIALHALGNVPSRPEHASRTPVGGGYKRAAAVDPTDAPVWPQHPQFHRIGAPICNGRLQRGTQWGPVCRVDVANAVDVRQAVVPRLQAEDPIVFGRPAESPAVQIQRPTANVGDLLRLGELCLGPSQCLLRLAALGDVHRRAGHADERAVGRVEGAAPVFEPAQAAVRPHGSVRRQRIPTLVLGRVHLDLKGRPVVRVNRAPEGREGSLESCPRPGDCALHWRAARSPPACER